MSVKEINGSDGASYSGNGKNNDELPLAKLLGKNTAQVHHQLEGTSFGRKWSKGTISETEYVMYLADLYCIYYEMERQLESWGHVSCLSSLQIKGLYRTEALKKDMNYFNVPFNAAGAASQDYQKRLWICGNQKPHLLIAHIWVRYMGDLFGGQMAKKNIEERWPGGTAFYEYDQLKQDNQITEPARFVAPFRKILNQLDLTSNEKLEVVEEAVWAFDQHLKIFQELSNPSRERYIYAYAVPILIKWNPLKLASYIPDSLKIWQ